MGKKMKGGEEVVNPKLTNQEEYKVIRGSVNGQAKYCRIPIRRKTDNAMAIQMIQKEVAQLKNPAIMDNDCLEIELEETDFERRIEVLEMATVALAKQVPMEPEHHTCRTGDYYNCPECGNRVVYDIQDHYCNECGQCIDWERKDAK